MASPYSGRTIDYLGGGLIAARPVSLNLNPGTIGFWYATDVGAEQLSVWDGLVWADIAGGGGGSGDVVGPASSTNDFVALFDGTTGKLLKQGTGALGTAAYTAATAYATAAQGTTADSAVQPGDLATIATTGALLDATDFPGGTTDFLRADGSFAAPPGGGGGLTNWTEAINSAGVNSGLPVVSFTATNAAGTLDAAIVPKGSGGALLGSIPNGSSTGGNKRGSGATDWQRARAAAGRIASGFGAVIGGGEDNTSGGDYSTVPGGYLNNVTGNGATGSGDSNTVAGNNATSFGQSNTVAGAGAIGIGVSNTASSATSIALGNGNIASASNATAIGDTCSALAQRSHARGYSSSTRTVIGCKAYASGSLGTLGDAQSGLYVLRSDTSGATPESLTTNNSAAGATNQLILPDDSAFSVTGTITARESGGNAQSWKVEAFIVRGSGAGSVVLVAGGTPSVVGTIGTFAGTLALTADTTNGGLAITVTGVAATNIKWVAALQTCEVSA
jgi:hypothetical protein